MSSSSELQAPAPALPGTRAGHIVAELRRLIKSGEIPSGSHLRQTEIAKRFGVSTTPVREAFLSLAREGLVEHGVHRGVVVFAPRLQDLRENYEIRGALEPLAAELAAKQLTPEQLDALDDLVAEMRAESDLMRYQQLNRRFHSSIYEAAQRPRLLQIIEMLRDASEAYLRVNASRETPDSGYIQQVHAEHEAIAEALRQSQARRIRKLTADHLKHNLMQLEKLVVDDTD